MLDKWKACVCVSEICLCLESATPSNTKITFLCYEKKIKSLYELFIVLGFQGSCEALNRSCGCCGSILEDEVQREHCESACDLATHVFCHVCALCQEGRELRRRLPHPGFNAQPVLVMIPPGEQTMGREAWKFHPSSWKCYSCVYYCCLVSI